MVSLLFSMQKTGAPSSSDLCARDMETDDTMETHAEGVGASGPITIKTTPTLCNFLHVDDIGLDQGRIGGSDLRP